MPLPSDAPCSQSSRTPHAGEPRAAASGPSGVIPLEALGSRICILGPSNSGKSTLAEAIGHKRGLPPVHLDRLHHLPNTDWRPRPAEEFLALHDQAIAAPDWVMDGNYGRCLPQRLERATGVILLDVSTTTSLLRYFRRSWFERDRRGGLDGGSDSVKLNMIHHIVVVTPPSRTRYRTIFDGLRIQKVALIGTRALADAYRAWDLSRHPLS